MFDATPDLQPLPPASVPAPKAAEGVLAKPFFNRWRLGFLAVLALSILAYLPCMTGQRIWDDNALLDGSGVGGETIGGALSKPFLGAYFRPLVSVTFVVENWLWKGNPFFYHQTNLLIHMATCAALLGVLLLAFGNRRVALVGGALFAVQPAQVSTVAWIGGRTDSLCALLVALFALGLILAVRAHGRKRAAWATMSASAFFLALTTKEPILALLPLVPLGLVAFGEPAERRNRASHLKLLAPYLFAGFVFVALWLAFYPNPFKPFVRGPIEQLATAGHALLYFALLLLVPTGRWMHTLSLGTFEAIGWASAVAGLLALAWFTWGTLRSARRDPRLGWFLGLALLSLLPVSNLIPLPSLLVAPYRAGVAGLGVAAALAVWLVRGPWPSARLRAPIGAAFAAWCAWLTFWGAGQWSDAATLFSRVAASDPSSIVARRNLSGALLKRGGEPEKNGREAARYTEEILTDLYGSEAWRDPKEAVRLFETDRDLAWRIKTNQGNYVKPEAWLGELFGQLGYARAKAGDFQASKRAFETAVLISPMNFGVRAGLAQYAMHEGNYREAAAHLRVAKAAHAKDAGVAALLGEAYARQGLWRLASANYRESITIRPWFGPVYLALSDAQLRLGDRAGAVATLRQSQACRVQDEEGLRRRMVALGAPVPARRSAPHAHDGHAHVGS